jgi:hypothetical protein
MDTIDDVYSNAPGNLLPSSSSPTTSFAPPSPPPTFTTATAFAALADEFGFKPSQQIARAAREHVEQEISAIWLEDEHRVILSSCSWIIGFSFLVHRS